ncbi:MAG: exodeoxyribonuclease V subunit alpha [Chitinophagaceae bacterium]
MQTLTDVHQQFAGFFRSEALRPYAYLVSRKLAEGHICLDLGEAEEELADETILLNPSALKKNPWVTTDQHIKKAFVLHANRLYLQRYFSYETDILERIKSFITTNPGFNPEILKVQSKLIGSLFPNAGKDDWQKIAAISAVLNNLTIITGGPGTGKTTTVAKILAILYAINPDLKVALVAPTGKAAVRMAESLRSATGKASGGGTDKLGSLKPLTIHRLLGYKPDSPYFRHDKENPLAYDLVIADESSMIDAALFAKLMNAIGTHTRLILLGDKNQLASVEAGSLFGDLCNSVPEKRVPLKIQEIIQPAEVAQSHLSSTTIEAGEHSLANHIIELKQSYRFSADKGIGKFSRAIINNESAIIETFISANDHQELQIDTTYDEHLFEAFIKGYTEYINEPDIKSAIKKFNTLRVLCAIRSSDQGVHAVNKKVEKYLAQQKLIRTTTEFYEHRPIIITKNYYELDLFNGDVGIIRKDAAGNLKAWFEDGSDGVKSIPPGFLAESETVFAMTIHKSQGSEYDQVLVMLPAREIPLLTAELLYTGVTRAKSKVLIQSAEDVLRSTAAKRVKRASGITERLKEENLL